jgi:hypothetical protein
MNPYTRYRSSGSGIFCEFDNCPRFFLGCHISASEEMENSLSWDRQPRRSRCFCRPYPVGVVELLE